MSAFNVENQPKFNSIQFAQTVPVKSTSVRPLFGATKTKDQAKLTGQLEKDFPWTKDIKPLKTTSISVDEWFYKKSGKEEIDNKITEINKKISQLDKQAPTNKSKLDKLEKQISELEKKRYKTRFTLLLSKAFKKWNADRVAQNKANKHLPREFKKRIFWYKTTTYWWKKWFSPSKAKCKLVTLQGPIAIKAKQAFVQSRLSEVEQYEKQLESINTKVKRKKLINETLKDFDKDLKNLDKKITETDKELKALDKKIKETKDPTTKIELSKTKAELTNT